MKVFLIKFFKIYAGLMLRLKIIIMFASMKAMRLNNWRWCSS